MKKIGKRLSSITVCMVLAISIMSGCGNSGKSQTESVAASAEEAAAKEAVAEETSSETESVQEIAAAAVLPPELANLKTISAEPWIQVCDIENCEGLEGPAFDKDGNLYVCHLPHEGAPSGIFKVSVDGTVSSFYELEGPPAVTIAIDQNELIYAGLPTGQILVLDKNGNLKQTLAVVYGDKALHIDDMAFDQSGNLYLTDFSGDITAPSGGVYRLEASSEYQTITPVVENLVGPNGLSFSPDYRTLWVSESTRGDVLRIGLNEEGMPEGRTPDSGIHPVYYTTGMNGPDSNKTDIEDNLYQVMFGTGRAVILNDRGIPIANIIINGSEKGENLFTTNLVIQPGTKEGYIVSGGKTGGWISKFDAIADGSMYSHQ